MAQAQLPPSDCLRGSACTRWDLPSAWEQAGSLPSPPPAERLPGRELHCAEDCALTQGALGVSPGVSAERLGPGTPSGVALL